MSFTIPLGAQWPLTELAGYGSGQTKAMDDWELLAKASSDRDALEWLFARHKDYVFRLAYGFTSSEEAADDAVQEVFLRLGSGSMKWEPRAKFRTWLYQVTLNVTREMKRQANKELELPETHDEADEHPSVNPAQGLVMRDMLRALDQLPEKQREVVVLRFLEGMTTKETAKILRVTEGTVKTNLHRAVKTLREFYENAQEGDKIS